MGAKALGWDGAAVLLRLGWPRELVQDMEEAARPEQREKALRWVWGLETKTRIVDGREQGGRNRGRRVKHCGTLFPALLASGRVTVRARVCRDRACPACMARRSREYGIALRRTFEARAMSPSSGGLAFVTLTQVKRGVRGEDARAAVTRLLGSWSDLTSTRLAIGRATRELVAGAIRSVEVTWSGKGKRQRNGGGRVAYTGWHAHAHAMFELAPGVTVPELELWLEDAWQWASPGANPLGLNVQPLDTRRVGQVAKYVTKPFDIPPRRARELFLGLEGRRTIEGVGTLKGWRKHLPEDEPRDAVVAWGESGLGRLGMILDMHARGRGRRPELARYLFRSPAGETLANMSEAELIQALRADAAPRSPTGA